MRGAAPRCERKHSMKQEMLKPSPPAYFFFQAEDGIRDGRVTGVQTCALPISYDRLRPLPTGLHFTPAMSARALLDRDAHVKLIEIDMPYHERVGDSKLKVGKDGLRFLNVITRTAIEYRPARVATILGVTLAVAGTAAVALARRNSRRV